MKKLERRAVLVLLLTVFLLSGTALFVFRFVRNGSKWATFYANASIYSNGYLKVGKIYDRNGVLLAENGAGENGAPKYSDDKEIRLATAHVVGDPKGNVSTSAENKLADQVIGYDLLNGTYSITNSSHKMRLSIDSEANRAAYRALGSRNGFAAVYNYETGEIVCLVSKPTFDPEDPPDVSSASSGTYMNKVLSGRFVPGSTFKLITSAAAIETLDDLDDFTFDCTGTYYVNGEKITCTHAHGHEDFESALANSCNGAFGKIAIRVGAANMKAYTEKCGLTHVYSIDGINNVKGSFDFPSNADLNLGWAGIGQWKDLVNPLSMLVYMGAIAGDGKAAEPHLLHSSVRPASKTSRMIESSTAEELQRLMKNNVTSTYGASNYPGLDIYAKSGTAEVGDGTNNAWFVGFIKNTDAPYAFVVCVENGSSGSVTAGPVARAVLDELVGE